jgi:hypothetical protein
MRKGVALGMLAGTTAVCLTGCDVTVADEVSTSDIATAVQRDDAISPSVTYFQLQGGDDTTYYCDWHEHSECAIISNESAVKITAGHYKNPVFSWDHPHYVTAITVHNGGANPAFTPTTPPS